MIYRGTVKNGVIVLEGTPGLQDGTVVRVEPVDLSRAQRGTAEAIMHAVESGAHWHGGADEADSLLAELKEMKQAELKAQNDLDSDRLLDKP